MHLDGFRGPEISEKDEARLQVADETTLTELKSGKFDAGLAPDSFKDDVSRLHPASASPEYHVTLVEPDRSRFLNYVEPTYPWFALFAQMSGRVELKVTYSDKTGELKDLAIISGHRLLAQPAEDAVRRWRVAPELANDTGRIALDFGIDCQ